jgi:AcrR family transcriptional regulator
VALFTERGYAGTSLEEISRNARVTKGALYHHFAGKKALFEAAFHAVESSVFAKLVDSMSGDLAPWDNAMGGLRAFLEICLEPSFQRIVESEGPVVLGVQRWRERDEHFTFGMIRDTLAGLIDAGEIDPLPPDALARIVYGAASAGAAMIAGSSDPRVVSDEVGKCMERLFSGLRATKRS